MHDLKFVVFKIITEIMILWQNFGPFHPAINQMKLYVYFKYTAQQKFSTDK